MTLPDKEHGVSPLYTSSRYYDTDAHAEYDQAGERDKFEQTHPELRPGSAASRESVPEERERTSTSPKTRTPQKLMQMMTTMKIVIHAAIGNLAGSIQY